MFGNKYTEFNVAVPKSLGNVTVNKVRSPYNYTEKNKPLILMVFKAIDVDISNGALLSSYTGELLETCLTKAKEAYKHIPPIEDYRVLATHFNYVEDSTNYETCFSFNKRRLKKIIAQNKPDYIWTFTRYAFDALSDSIEVPHSSCSYGNLLGTPVPLETGPTLFPITDIDRMFDFKDGDRASPAYLLGYVIQNIANALNTKRIWSIEKATSDIKCTYVDTITKFRKMMAHLRKYDTVSVDTETTGLEKVQVKMLTVQFAVKPSQGFFLPVCHYDTPFTTSEVDEILFELKAFFETHKFKYVIFHNTNYDLNVLRSNLGIKHMPFDTWDTQDGEYANDENMMALSTVSGGKSGFYNLLNLSTQYGFFGYVTGDFGKSDRNTITNIPLNTKGLVEYGCYDVCVPLAIYQLQLKRARYKKHDQYEVLVGKQLSDTQHVFSVLNQVGALLDIQYLWWLDSEESPLKAELVDAESKILSLPEIKEAEDLIRKAEGRPKRGLFGDVKGGIFNLRTKKHVQTLFFDVLGFDKVSIGKDGSPNIDKAMQKKYADNPVMKAYGDRNKVLTLINTYVSGTIKRISMDKDAQADSRIRSSYRYHNVVSFRSSSAAPNLQNIPEHGNLGKRIKRCFVAPPGHLIIKIDYSAAEVRCLGNVANDTEFGKAFKVGVDLRKDYLSKPTDDRKFKMSTVGDVHMVNAAYFFDLALDGLRNTDDIKKIKPFRQQVKGIVFGLVYGRGVKAMAAAIDKDVDYTEGLIDKFYAKFRGTHKWLLGTEKQAQEKLYVENPMGARRHLWPYLLPKTWRKAYSIHAACDRRARNSPIQGYASMINYCAMRLFEKQVYKMYGHEKKLPIQIFNTVHDSTFAYVRYDYIFPAISLLRRCMTSGVQQLVQKRHGENANFPIPIEIDFDVGGSLATCERFDGKLSNLFKIVKNTLTWQKKEMKYDINVSDELSTVFGSDGENITKDFIAQTKNGHFDLEAEFEAVQYL